MQTKPPSHPLEWATPSLWSPGSGLLGATVMGERAGFPGSIQSSKPQSSYSSPHHRRANPRSAAHPQLSYEGAGAGEQHVIHLKGSSILQSEKLKHNCVCVGGILKPGSYKSQSCYGMRCLPQKRPGVQHTHPCNSSSGGRVA